MLSSRADKAKLFVSDLIIILWFSLEKGECFDFSHSLGCQPYSIGHYTSKSSLSFQLADLLSLLIMFEKLVNSRIVNHIGKCGLFSDF